MAQEVELKLAFPASARNALLRHPLIADAERVGPAQTLVNTYFDTPDLALKRARVALRTRKAGRRWLQTVKCAAASLGGLASRPEWEQPYRDQQFAFEAIDHAPTRALLERHATDIQPLFTTTFRRETRRLVLEDGTAILLMIDSGEIAAEERREALNELELELEQGDARQLLELGLQLADDLPLLPENASKAERGYRLFHAEPRLPVRAARSPLGADDDLLHAFRAIAFEALNAWQANVIGGLDNPHPEFTHQLRVALRRLRTLLQVFAELWPGDGATAWQAELGELAAQAGLRRDLDVLREEIVAPLQEDDLAQLCVPVSERLAHEAALAAHAFATSQHAPGAGLPMLRMARDLHALPPSEPDTPLPAFAARALSGLRKSVRERQRIAAATPSREHLHALRIRLKRLRYALEFFAPLYASRKALAAYLRDITRALDELGYLNDLAATDSLLLSWESEDPRMAAARAFIAGWHARRARKTRRKALARIDSLLAARPPWRT